eukprot:TRINITY_DN2855_c0_g1_i3.p1 TRINITY_DN2855_c0_g1~~TRINITY_DN2855_c0_g1_i3.p1  ORF type:complete len:169 (+),score=44.44 TRINITY_DN2855_c0_g1_i3:178-684(+)
MPPHLTAQNPNVMRMNTGQSGMVNRSGMVPVMNGQGRPTPINAQIINSSNSAQTNRPVSNPNQTLNTQSTPGVNNNTVSREERVKEEVREQLANPEKIREILSKLDPNQEIEDEAVLYIQREINQFVVTSLHSAAKLAGHRKSQVVEKKDLSLHLDRVWNIRVPGGQL